MPNTYNTVSYIDTTYYTSAYKPAIQASIQDKYLNGPKNAANFNAFAERATEAVNRLTNNTIEGVIGGFDLLPTTPAALVQKATAAIVEYWFLQGYDLGIINSQISNTIVKGKTVKQTIGMREFIPETALWLLQTSGLTDQTFLGAESDKDLMNHVIPGFTVNDFFTKAEQLALFQEKGDYDNNFHKDVVIQGELTGTTAPRYFLIGKSQPGQTHMVFSFLGGNEEDVLSAKQIVSITKGATGIDFAESSVVTLNPKATDANVAVEEPEVFAGVNANDEIEVYIETKADQNVADILITDITPDDNAEYGLFSSTLNAPTDAFILGKYGVVQGAATTNGLQTQIDNVKTTADKNVVAIAAINPALFATKIELATNTQAITTNAGDIKTNSDDIAALTTTTIPGLVSTKMDTTVANGRFIHKAPQANSAEADMVSGYVPVNDQAVTTKTYVDAAVAVNKGLIDGLDGDISSLKSRVSSVEGTATSNASGVSTNTSGLASVKTTADDTAADVARLEPIVTQNTTVVNAMQTQSTKNTADIVTLKADDASLSGRVEAIEDAQELDDKVWEGSIDGADTIDVSALTDKEGNPFDFATGDKIEFVFEHTASQTEEGEDLVVGASNATKYSLGTVGFTAKIDTTGTLTLVKPSGAGSISDFKLIRIVEAKTVKPISASYSKAESDAKYVAQNELDALDARVVTAQTAATKGITDAAAAQTTATAAQTTGSQAAASAAQANGVASAAQSLAGSAQSAAQAADAEAKGAQATATANSTAIASNTTALTGKQNITDNTLTTTDKTVVGAINEIKTTADGAETTVADLGAKPVSGGSLLSTAETLATEAYVNAHTPTLPVDMLVNFEDGTSETYKVGK